MSDDSILHEYKKGYPVRVFRPWEVRALVRSIPKNEYKDKFEALLFSGCRYSEMKWLFDHPARFKGEHIHMRNTKALAKEAYRWVRLNMQGQRAVENFLRCKHNLPSYPTWNENLKRWCKQGGVDPMSACAKSTRKTLESWLVISFPNRVNEIFISQGHEETTALRHYLTFPFTSNDKQDMMYYVEGW